MRRCCLGPKSSGPSRTGNLGKQLEQLEEEGYLDSKKEFVGRRPNTTYRLLPYGREQFTQYVALLESLLAQAEEEKPEA